MYRTTIVPRGDRSQNCHRDYVLKDCTHTLSNTMCPVSPRLRPFFPVS